MEGGALGYTESFLAQVRRRPLEAELPRGGREELGVRGHGELSCFVDLENQKKP